MFVIIYRKKLIVIENNNTFTMEHLYANEKLLDFTNVKLVSLVTDSKQKNYLLTAT